MEKVNKNLVRYCKPSPQAIQKALDAELQSLKTKCAQVEEELRQLFPRDSRTCLTAAEIAAASEHSAIFRNRALLCIKSDDGATLEIRKLETQPDGGFRCVRNCSESTANQAAAHLTLFSALSCLLFRQCFCLLSHVNSAQAAIHDPEGRSIDILPVNNENSLRNAKTGEPLYPQPRPARQAKMVPRPAAHAMEHAASFAVLSRAPDSPDRVAQMARELQETSVMENVPLMPLVDDQVLAGQVDADALFDPLFQSGAATPLSHAEGMPDLQLNPAPFFGELEYDDAEPLLVALSPTAGVADLYDDAEQWPMDEMWDQADDA